MKNKAEVVIIGGGVIGCSIAYELAKLGLTDIQIIEKKFLSSGSTGRCGGGIRQQWATAPNIEMAMKSVARFEELEDELEYDFEYQQGGYLVLAYTEQFVENFKKNVKLQQSMGLDVSFLKSDEICDIVPEINTDKILGATFCHTDGHANPFLMTYAYGEAAKRLGVEIETYCEVTGIKVENGRVKGVQTSKGFINTPMVINAAGGYSQVIGKMAGLDLPTKSFKHEIIITEAVEQFFTPMIISFDYNIYFRQTPHGSIIMGCGDKDEPSSFNVTSTRKFLHEISDKACGLMPCLSKLAIVRQWAGLYNMSPDAQPILGGVDELEGYMQAIGFSGHGVMLAPITAMALAEKIVKGKAESFDIDSLHINRFKTGNLILESSVV